MGKVCSRDKDDNYQQCQKRKINTSSYDSEEMKIQTRYQNSLILQQNTTSIEKTVVFTGTSESGKTSLIYFLKNNEVKLQCLKTKIIEQYQIHFNGQVYDVKDLPLYQQDIKTDAWVYVQDSTKEPDELNKFLQKLDVKIPVLVYLNKSDLSNIVQNIENKID